MKKISLIIGLVAGVSFGVNAQHFITSYGFQLSWGMPFSVQNTISHDYYGYDIVHATQVNRYGFSFFDVILQNHNAFIKVSVRNDGFISRREILNHNPLYNHVCDGHCGYNSSYYTAYYDNCNSHNHFRHNHVTYVKYVEPKHGHGHAYGYYGKSKKTYQSSYEKSPARSVDKRKTYTRRDRYYDDPKQVDRSSRPSRTRYTGNSRNSNPVKSRTGN